MTKRPGALEGTLLVVWLGLVGWLTLRSDPAMRDVIRTTSWSCLVCGTGGTTDTILNLILYAPFGVVGYRSGWKVLHLMAGALVLSVAVEVTQGTLLVGRDATLGDVLSNTLGAGLGWWLSARVAALTSSRRGARLVTVGIIGVQGMVWLGTGFGLRPALNGPLPWVGRFQRAGSGQVPFVGTVGATALDGIPVTTEPMERVPGPDDSLHLSIALSKGEAFDPSAAGSILRMVDGTPRVFVRVIQRGEDIMVETALHATPWRFRTPTWRFSDALAIPPLATVRYDWYWHLQSIELRRTSTDSALPEFRQQLGLTLGLGWAFVHPFVQVIDARTRIWSLLWVAGWFSLLGWWGRIAGWRFGVASAVGGLGTFLLVGVITQLPVSGEELAAACGGAITGAVIAELLSMRTPRT